MKLEILGTGCPRCRILAANVEKAVLESGVDAEIVKVTQLKDIMNYGVMLTPALAVDGTVKVAGKVLSVEEIKKFIT